MSDFKKSVNLFKETKWVSYGTYIMTVEGFGHTEGVEEYSPIMNTFNYKSDAYIVNVKYNDQSYLIGSKELYNNVSKGDKIVVTIKYFYDKDENLIQSNIHKYHPYPISND